MQYIEALHHNCTEEGFYRKLSRKLRPLLSLFVERFAFQVGDECLLIIPPQL